MDFWNISMVLIVNELFIDESSCLQCWNACSIFSPGCNCYTLFVSSALVWLNKTSSCGMMWLILSFALIKTFDGQLLSVLIPGKA
jgi:hypothetical protein